LGVTVSENNNKSLMVGELLVEPTLASISRGLKTVNLRPQVMELLVFLASNQGRVVSVDELFDKLWHGKVVTEGTLYNCIGELRHAISSLDVSRPYIENIPKKGYRLSVAVREPVEPPKASEADKTEDGEKQRNLSYGSKAALVLIAGLVAVFAIIYYLSATPKERSVAVLPFEDISPGRDQAYLVNGIADELRLELQLLDGLQVAGRTSSIAYAQEDGKTAGKLLNVDAIIEGSIRKEGENLRITTQLARVEDGFIIWSEGYNRKLENVFELQEEIATSVAGALGVRFGVGTINSFKGAGTLSVPAYELYLQAQAKTWSAVHTTEKIRLLERAVEIDPNYAAAWSLLGISTLSTIWDVPLDQGPGILKKANQRALRGVSSILILQTGIPF